MRDSCAAITDAGLNRTWAQLRDQPLVKVVRMVHKFGDGSGSGTSDEPSHSDPI